MLYLTCIICSNMTYIEFNIEFGPAFSGRALT